MVRRCGPPFFFLLSVIIARREPFPSLRRFFHSRRRKRGEIDWPRDRGRENTARKRYIGGSSSSSSSAPQVYNRREREEHGRRAVCCCWMERWRRRFTTPAHRVFRVFFKPFASYRLFRMVYARGKRHSLRARQSECRGEFLSLVLGVFLGRFDNFSRRGL